jgi:hypothetical protein
MAVVLDGSARTVDMTVVTVVEASIAAVEEEAAPSAPPTTAWVVIATGRVWAVMLGRQWRPRQFGADLKYHCRLEQRPSWRNLELHVVVARVIELSSEDVWVWAPPRTCRTSFTTNTVRTTERLLTIGTI